MRVVERAISATEEGSFTKPPVRRRKKKEGRIFFLTLLTGSGIVILFLSLIYFQGKELMIFTFERFVINKVFVSLLPDAYTLDQREAIREEVYDFYEAAWDDEVNETALIEVSSVIQGIMKDDHIAEDEVNALLSLIRERREM